MEPVLSLSPLWFTASRSPERTSGATSAQHEPDGERLLADPAAAQRLQTLRA